MLTKNFDSLTIAILMLPISAFSAGMQAPDGSTVPKPPFQDDTVHEARWEDYHQDGRKWTLHTYDQVGNIASSLMSKTPSDGESFCPGFNKLDDSGRKNFYTYLLSAMAKFESNYNPSLQYRESFKDSSGSYVISRGLLQLSYESAKGYGCNIKTGSDLHDPKTNLTCSIKILDRWIGRDGRITGYSSGAWRGGARYWSVLRKDSTLNSIRSWTRAFCEQHF